MDRGMDRGSMDRGRRSSPLRGSGGGGGGGHDTGEITSVFVRNVSAVGESESRHGVVGSVDVVQGSSDSVCRYNYNIYNYLYAYSLLIMV